MFSFFKIKSKEEREKANQAFMNPSEEELEVSGSGSQEVVADVVEEKPAQEKIELPIEREEPSADIVKEEEKALPVEEALEDDESSVAVTEAEQRYSTSAVEHEPEENLPEDGIVAQQASAPSEKEDGGWFARLSQGLKRTGKSITEVFTGRQIDDELYEELEMALLMADTGVSATQYLLDDLKERVKTTKATTPEEVKALLVESLTELLQPLEAGLEIGCHTPTVMMVAGVNGAGKTTSIGKLTRHLALAGQSVLLAAGDTFRAAAKEQLAVWADRNQVQIISQEGGDPASVSFDAIAAGRSRQTDVVIIDTAGRLATQPHLMEELKKIRRVTTKAMESAPHEVLLVIDGNTGQNALAQVKAFDEAIDLTGLIVTKLDGSAKGGVIAAIALWSAEREQAGKAKLPIYFIGVGEQVEDLQAFDAKEFSEALLH